MKKVLLLVVALAALALPASASASAYDTWTIQDWTLSNEETYGVQYTGQVGFTRDSNWGASQGSFYCEASVWIALKGGQAPGDTQAQLLGLERDPSSCGGTGNWAGCELEKEANNMSEGWNPSAGWNIGLAPSTPEVSNTSTTLDLSTWYANGGGTCYGAYPVSPVERHWNQLDFVPTVNGEGVITSFMLEGLATNGVSYEVYGPFAPVEPEGEYMIGLE
ncbi:MAG TPA: hypothetical protein VGO66_07935 [Solirubrobacterales bacterium]|jgi:hypothetical protein|nr:hypothetical protein [Solirubrobacterales bacterium]